MPVMRTGVNMAAVNGSGRKNVITRPEAFGTGSASGIRREGGPALLAVCLMIGAVALTGFSAQGHAQTPASQDRRQGAAKVTQEAGPGQDAAAAREAEQVDDSYQPVGVELGSFLLFPRLETDVTYSSNVFASESDVRSDFVNRISPEVRLRSRFTRHELNFRGELEQYLFRRYTEDNRLDGSLSADGRLDIHRAWEATGFLNLVKRAEDRGSPNVEQGKEPAQTYAGTALFGSRLQQGRYIFQGDVGIDRRVFDDTETASGRKINNTDRNRWEYQVRGRTAYEFRPNYSAVVEGALNRRDYDDRLDDNGLNRSSEGFRLEAGLGVDVSQLIRGDFLVGYLHQDYEDPALSDPSGYAMKATFNWTPSRLTVVIPSLERTVQETVSANASSIIRTGGGLVVRHEFARNFIATVLTNLSFDEYGGSTEEAWNYEARVRGIYAFSREWYAGAEIGYRGRESNRAGSSYDQVTTLVRIGVRI